MSIGKITNIRDSQCKRGECEICIINNNYEHEEKTNVPQNVPQNVPHSSDKSLDLWIEEQIRINPKITTDELAKLSDKTSKTIKRHIAKMPHIKYIGRGNNGHWEVTQSIKSKRL